MGRGRKARREPKRTTWNNWNDGTPDEACFDDLSPGRAPAFCFDCDEWFAYVWGNQGYVKHPSCGEKCTFAY